jgi:hypothetical protein
LQSVHKLNIRLSFSLILVIDVILMCFGNMENHD